jgi:hypothetical protein
MNHDSRNPWQLPSIYDGKLADRMSQSRRAGITFYFVRAVWCNLHGANASAVAYLEKAIRMSKP